MQYKRTEYFRYTFGEPLEAKFRIATTGDPGTTSGVGACSLLDISPSGAKLAMKFDIPSGRDSSQLLITFTLYKKEVEVRGNIVWKRQYRDTHLYGINFDEDLVREQLITDELKLLSREKLERNKKSDT